jgi:mannose-6-phosphate isomerase-like protein (cupin superfamily)
MKIFDLSEMTAAPYELRGRNVFYQANEFKTRIIELPAGGQIPYCEMASYVIFYVLDGEVKVTVNTELVSLKKNQCLITEPSTFSMQTDNGVKIMGIQIAKKEN